MSRAFLSRLFLDISCDRDAVMLGSAKDFWRLHPEITDTDTLLDVATDKLDLIMSSSVRDLPEFESIIQCYVHDMFPYYLAVHVMRVVEYVRDGYLGASPRLDCTRESADDHHTECPSPSSLALVRPPRPMSYATTERACDSLDANTQFVDVSGRVCMTDKSGTIRWFGVKMGGSIRWKLCRDRFESIRSVGSGRFRVNVLVVERVWSGTDKKGLMEIWPGIPRFEDTRKIVRVYVQDQPDRVAELCAGHSKAKLFSLPLCPLDYKTLSVSVDGAYAGECVSVIVVREMEIVKCS